MIDYQVERYDTVIEEGIPLFVDHWNEIARNKGEIPLEPDYDAYKRMDELGNLLITTARCDGELIGYIINFVNFNIHYKSCLMSVTDILYLKPEYRGKSVFIKLLKFTEFCLTDLGVKVSHMRMKLSHDFGPVIERLGYTEIERDFEKVLIGGGS